jgi:hypothetical protein
MTVSRAIEVSKSEWAMATEDQVISAPAELGLLLRGVWQ